MSHDLVKHQRQIRDVLGKKADAFAGFLREDGTATASLTSMLVRKRRDLEPFGWDSVDGTSRHQVVLGSLVQPIAGWWFGTMEFYVPYIGNFIIPTDELIFFGGVAQPPTSNCFCILEL